MDCGVTRGFRSWLSEGATEAVSILQCIRCGEDLDAENVDLQSQIAKCAGCGAVFRIGESVENTPDDGFSPHDCPSGVTFNTTPNGFVLTASTRSWAALFLVPFTCVWSGGSLGSLYVMPLMAGGELSLLMGVFGLPFLAGSVVLVWMCGMMLFGQVRVTASGFDGSIFTGFGPVGRTKRFSWLDMHWISEESRRQHSNSSKQVLCLGGRSRVTFGSMLDDARRYHVRRTIEVLLRDLERPVRPAGAG